MPRDIDALADRVGRHGVAAVCVHPAWASRCAERLSGSSVKVVSVLGLSSGASDPAIKAAAAVIRETEEALVTMMIEESREVAWHPADALATSELGQ